MNRDKVLELAREAELARQIALEVPFVVDRLERFAALIEREVRGDAEPVFNDIDEALEKAYWRFDAMVKGYGEWKLRRQSERDAFKQAVRSIGPFSYVAPETLHESEECECVHLALSKRGVPDKDENGNKYSLWGRVELYASPALRQPANVNTVIVHSHPAPAVDAEPVSKGGPDLFAEFYEDGSFTGDASEFADCLEEPVALYRHPAPAVVRQLVEALDKAQDLIAGYLETFEKRGDKMPYGHKVLRQAQEALAAAKEAGL